MSTVTSVNENTLQIPLSAPQSSRCPICDSTRLKEVFKIRNVPILANVLWDRREDAQRASRGDISLAFCPACGHIFNQAFDPQKIDYNAPYENSLHFSPRFQQYAAWLAKYLVEKYGLHRKSIIEIGSGKGDFLRLLCELGGNIGTGFDPSYRQVNGDDSAPISIIQDYYTPRYAHLPADMIISRHVLEHIYHPAEFIAGLRETIGERINSYLFFEVPNASYILHDTAIWDVIYEHYSYFSPQSLSALLIRGGFDVLGIGEEFESQFLFIETTVQKNPGTGSTEKVHWGNDSILEQVEAFSKSSQEKLDQWRDLVSNFRSSGMRVVLWGAGSKGISLLNMLDVHDEIEYIIDINPRKKNKFVTGTGQQIVPPDHLATYRPDIIVIMNPIYKDEIQHMVGDLGLHPEFVIAT